MDKDPRDFPPGDLRVSDAERDLAVSELSKAFQVGRLTAAEFEQRSTQDFASRPREERPPAAAPGPGGAARPAAGASPRAAVANALNPGPTLQQRELVQQILA